MAPVVREMVSATYVRDISASRAFYELLGFAERRSGTAPTSAWSVLGNNGYLLLLVSTDPPVELPPLPLLFDFFLDDIDAAMDRLAAAGVPCDHQGHPGHAPGGEVKVIDPDGNNILIGQRAPSASGPDPAGPGGVSRFSLLQEAAAVAAARGHRADNCQARTEDGRLCVEHGEVKLADSNGDTLWVCLGHAEEILIAVPGVFMASHDDRGIAGFLAARRVYR
jgi:catechol 2,3-dioxygenase-like lactoylglutathione lyase family enzyme